TIGTTTEIELTDRQRAQFEMLSGRAQRFAGEAEQTAEYSSQITAMQQNLVNAKQTEITTVLTVVATICMSVSLLTSWYGMNLTSMPEKEASFTYVVVIGDENNAK
ncbi:MAG: hypothetical protein HUJ53_06130, partial [Holdemanella sp.]|nr:hypothetical protein [Holdemanella sp.]